MKDTLPPYELLMESAKAIHQDNLHLLNRIAASDCNHGIEFDCTLNGAQEHIFAFFEALASYEYGEVPWRDVEFMRDSTNALIQAIERHFHFPSARAVGQALRASTLWWCMDKPRAKISRKTYLKHLVSARESIYDALNAFNQDLFVGNATPSADPPPADDRIDKLLDLQEETHEAVQRIDTRGKDRGKRAREIEKQERCFSLWEAGRRNPVVVQYARGKVDYEAVFNYYKREIIAIGVENLEEFVKYLRRRIKRLSVTNKRQVYKE